MIYSACASRLRRSSCGYSTARLTLPEVCDIPAYDLARNPLWFHTVRAEPVKKVRQAQCIRTLRVHGTISQPELEKKLIAQRHDSAVAIADEKTRSYVI
jgi:hypothetical protein